MPLGHREKHHAPFRGQATAIDGRLDFLGVNSWKREWQNRLVGDGGVAFALRAMGLVSATESCAASAIYAKLSSLSGPV
jgi:hypothetical protein